MNKCLVTLKTIKDLVVENYKDIKNESIIIINSTRYDVDFELQDRNGEKILVECPDDGTTEVKVLIMELHINDYLTVYHPDCSTLHYALPDDHEDTTIEEYKKILKAIKQDLNHMAYAIDCRIERASSDIIKLTTERDTCMSVKEDIQVILSKLT